MLSSVERQVEGLQIRQKDIVRQLLGGEEVSDRKPRAAKKRSGLCCWTGGRTRPEKDARHDYRLLDAAGEIIERFHYVGNATLCDEDAKNRRRLTPNAKRVERFVSGAWKRV